MNEQLAALLREALVCSVFVDPTDPGLTRAELQEIGKQAGFQNGEIIDTIPHASKQEYGRSRYVGSVHELMFYEVHERSEPPLLSDDAVDFVYSALNERIREDGIRRAQLDRASLVERAVTAGHSRVEIEGAITCLLLCQILRIDEGRIAPEQTWSGPVRLLSEHRRQRSGHVRAARPKALALVRDVVARRSDGRPRHAEPFDAFGDALEQIGYRQFRSWWQQTVTELRGSDPGTAPIACTVLSAALVEGALTFAARHAREKKLGSFTSSNFDGEPRTWKAEKLIESAASGGAAAILTPPLKARAGHLNETRQRVHAGRMLSEHPRGVQDLRPEEGRDAKATAEQIVRAVLDWLARTETA